MNNKFVVGAVSAAVALALSGCGGGGSTSTVASTTTNSDGETISTVASGFDLPTEISAVPASTEASVSNSMRGLGGSLRSFARAASDLSDNSDYNTTQTKKFVEERALEQFDIIEEVLNAVGQTNYADEGNVNEGPYTAMVAWIEDEDGREVKTLQPWVIDSRMIVAPGPSGSDVDVNRVLAWIEEKDWEDPTQIELIKAEFRIYQAATVNADGSFADYGVWDMNVSFDDSGEDYFVATSRIDGSVNTIMVHEKGLGPGDAEMKGVLVRSGSTGYGKVAYPDWDFCWQSNTGPDCSPPSITAQYAYNSGYVAVDSDVSDNSDPVFKDRDPANAVEMTHRYGLFYDENPPEGVTAGDNLEKHKSFGFPIKVLGTGDVERGHAYYGAWQGRHEIWSGSPNGIDAGTTVVRDDRGSNDVVETYITSDKLNGTFTQRLMADGSLSDIKDITVETWINKHWDLMWNQTAGEWKSCAGWIEWGWDNTNQVDTLTCRQFTAPNDSNPPADIGFSTFDDFELLAGDDSGRKWVSVGHWDHDTQQHVDLVYDADGQSGAGFYIGQYSDGEFGPQIVATNTLFNPGDGDNIWVDVGGSIYIQYTGDFSGAKTGWVQKALLEFDQDTWTPSFDDAQDMDFSPEVGRDYYINSNGANFVVKRREDADAAASYDVLIELQSAANPVNIAGFVPAGVDHFRTPWRPEVKFNFVTDAADENFMKLEYATDDPNTNENDVGSVYTSGEWGLQAYNSSGEPLLINGDGTVTAITVDEYGFPDPAVYPDPDQMPRPTEFNWEYSEGGWGTQQFLICESNCSGNLAQGDYMILDNPVQLNPITVANGANEDKTLSLQFDGWMHGLPDLYHELSKNNWQMSQEVADKVVNIPAGTAVTDSEGVGYYLKPLEISIFLAEVPNTTDGLPDITAAEVIDLDDVPTFTDHGMGAKPEGAEVKYSEGKPVN